MHQVRRGTERGAANFGWLDSRHTFSFGHYMDQRHMGFGPLRVINEDRVAPGKGFDAHSHSDMEILSWVLDGALEHKDSLGTGSQIRPGDLQRMTAGTGVTHSEFNASSTHGVHFLQIWILPRARHLKPSYEQRTFTPASLKNQWHLLAAGDPSGDALLVHQDIQFFASRLEAGLRLTHSTNPDRKLWLQVARGSVDADGESLSAGDGMGWEGVRVIDLIARDDAEVLLFDMIQ